MPIHNINCDINVGTAGFSEIANVEDNYCMLLIALLCTTGTGNASCVRSVPHTCNNTHTKQQY
eukprot:8575419-Karenia_brevis.AAC.1